MKNLVVVIVDGVVRGFLMVNVPVNVNDIELMSIDRSLVVILIVPDRNSPTL